MKRDSIDWDIVFAQNLQPDVCCYARFSISSPLWEWTTLITYLACFWFSICPSPSVSLSLSTDVLACLSVCIGAAVSCLSFKVLFFIYFMAVMFWKMYCCSDACLSWVRLFLFDFKVKTRPHANLESGLNLCQKNYFFPLSPKPWSSPV